jgi:hypothetical protein
MKNHFLNRSARPRMRYKKTDMTKFKGKCITGKIGLLFCPAANFYIGYVESSTSVIDVPGDGLSPQPSMPWYQGIHLPWNIENRLGL